MSASLRRLLILCFVLLQGMAPLLHAHAVADDYGGPHLPGVAAGASVANVSPGWQCDHRVSPQAAIGVATSLEARQDGLPWGAPTLVHSGALADAGKGCSSERVPSRVLASQPPSPRLLPFACAPPRA